MSLNIQYGPIGQALGLAAQAGAGRRNARVAQDDLAFLRQMQQAQSDADRNYANEIQLALQAQQANAGNSLKAEAIKSDRDRQAQEMQFRQQQATLAQQNVQQDNTRADQGQQFQMQRAQAATQQTTDRTAQQQAYLGNLPDGPVKAQALEYFNATGKLPDTVIPQNPRQNSGSNLPPDYRMLDAQYRRVERQLQAAQTALKAVSHAGDLNKIPSKSLPAAISGQEAQFQQAAKRVQDLSAELGEVEDALGGFGQNQPAVPQANVNAIVQARSAPSQPRIVATAVNPQGQKLGFDANSGQWIPIP